MVLFLAAASEWEIKFAQFCVNHKNPDNFWSAQSYLSQFNIIIWKKKKMNSIIHDRYDQTLFEDTSVNRMRESLNLFNQILSLQWFRFRLYRDLLWMS